MGILNIGISGLHAAQYGLRTAGHNISNASVEGFSRQRIQQSTFDPMSSGAGFVGQGTNVTTVRRIYNEYLNKQMLTAGANAAEMDSYFSQISQIDNLFADSSAGLSPGLTEFFKAVQEMTAHPASVPARQAMLSASQSLVSRFGLLDQRLSEIRAGVNGMIASEIAEINSFAREIADINERILVAQSTAWDQPANDLLDQRDKLVTDLNKKIRATVIPQDDGTYSVFIGNGQPLAIGFEAYSLRAMNDSEDVNRTVVALESPGGGAILMPETMLTGGALGGLLTFRRESLDAAQNGLGRIAQTIAQNFNNQHRLGQDLNGVLGGNYFDMSLMGPTILPSSNNGAPAGAFTVGVADYGDLTTSDYRLTSHGGGNYSLLRLSDNAVLVNNAALPVSVDGMSFNVTTVPAANNTFLLQPTRAGAANLLLAIADPRQIAAAAPMRTDAALANTGTGKISAGTVNAPPPPNVNLQQTVTITFTGANTFNVVGTGTGNPVGVAYTSGSNITYNGWTLQISGAPAVGDVFTISQNLNGVSDNRNGNLLAALQSENTMSGSTATYQSSYAAIVAQVGNKTREVEVTGQAQQALLERTQTLRDEVSGVNLDEEAASLLRYQQAYQAAAKVIGIAGSLFDEILAAVR